VGSLPEKGYKMSSSTLCSKESADRKCGACIVDPNDKNDRASSLLRNDLAGSCTCFQFLYFHALEYLMMQTEQAKYILC